MFASLFRTYDIGPPRFRGSGVIGIVDPTIGVNIALDIPFAFAVAFPFSLAFAFSFPVAPLTARTSFAALAPLAAPLPERREDTLVGFFRGAFCRPLLFG